MTQEQESEQLRNISEMIGNADIVVRSSNRARSMFRDSRFSQIRGNPYKGNSLPMTLKGHLLKTAINNS